MQKKSLPRTLLTLLIFSMIALAFYILWSRQLPLGSRLQEGSLKQSNPGIRPVYSLKPFVVELRGRYVKVTRNDPGERPVLGTGKKVLIMMMDLELQDEEAKAEVSGQLNQVREMIHDIVSSMHIKELDTIEEKAALGEEIVSRLNQVFQRKCVTQTLFREFVIQ